MRVSIGTAAVTTASTFFDLLQSGSGSATTRPSASITPEMPMFTLRTMARRASTARNRQIARCCSCSSVPSNQPSLEMFTKKSTGSLATYCRARYGSESS